MASLIFDLIKNKKFDINKDGNFYVLDKKNTIKTNVPVWKQYNKATKKYLKKCDKNFTENERRKLNLEILKIYANKILEQIKNKNIKYFVSGHELYFFITENNNKKILGKFVATSKLNKIGYFKTYASDRIFKWERTLRIYLYTNTFNDNISKIQKALEKAIKNENHSFILKETNKKLFNPLEIITKIFAGDVSITVDRQGKKILFYKNKKDRKSFNSAPFDKFLLLDFKNKTWNSENIYLINKEKEYLNYCVNRFTI